MNPRQPTLPRTPTAGPRTDALEARVALRILSHLSDASENLPHDVTERLRVARERALDKARTVHKLSRRSADALQVLANGSLVLGGPPPWWLRMASFLPLAVLLGGLLLIQHRYNEEQISAAVEIDAALLVDELPPQAYSDPGFVEFLRTPRSQE
jgi:hypothetical protein